MMGGPSDNEVTMSEPTPLRPTPPASEQGMSFKVGGGTDTYKTVTEGVEPYVAVIGDRSFRFTRKPNAKLQLQLARIADEKMGAKQIGFVADVLSAMLENSAEVDDILELVDAEEVARLINNVTRKMSSRPTTGQPGSSPSPSETTLDTGSPEQG